jgi:hypothetical protein
MVNPRIGMSEQQVPDQVRVRGLEVVVAHDRSF